jgi:inner membrane protein
MLGSEMPSPLGHILGGAAVYLAGTRRESRSGEVLVITLVASILPDFDFLPGILIGDMRAFHHGISHSLAAAVLFGGVVFLFKKWQQADRALLMGSLAMSAYASHVLFDLVSVNDGARGVPVLWPLSDQYFGFNLGLLGFFRYGPISQGIWSIVRWDNLSPLFRELIIVGGLVIVFLWKERLSSCGFNKWVHKANRRQQNE